MGRRNRGGGRLGALILGSVLTPLLGACEARPGLALDAALPSTAPVRNITSFDESLRCMDNLFLTEGKRDIYITTAGIPDATGLIAAGTKEMFISAVSKMSEKSSAFRFVDYDPTQLDVQLLSQLVGLTRDFVAPNYYVRGAITQLDSGVLASSQAAGLSLPYVDLGVSRDQIVSVVSVDLNVGQLLTRQILPGISANNSIAVVQSGKGADVGGLIGKAGISFSVSLDRSEGFHQAVRTLIDLSTIEVLGKLTRTPYWQCLNIGSTNPAFRSEARTWFDEMGSAERDRFARTTLLNTGYLQSADGPDADLTAALARYQAEHDLIPSGHADFDFYYSVLAGESRRRVASAAAAPTPIATTSQVATAQPAEPLRISLDTSRGEHPAYQPGEILVLQATPSRDAYIYCYYQDAGGTVARIFPNRFQPDAFVRANTPIHIPPAAGSTFSIRFDKPRAREAVACLGTNREAGLLLPAPLKAQDLAPLPVPGLDAVVAEFRAVGGTAVQEARVLIEVTQ